MQHSKPCMINVNNNPFSILISECQDSKNREKMEHVQYPKYTVTSMLSNNYFNLSSKMSKWRSPLSLRGLTSEETDINELNKSLRIGEVSSQEQNKNILSASCLQVHNLHNLMCVGARPDNRHNNNSNNGELQIYNCVVSTSKDDDDHRNSSTGNRARNSFDAYDEDRYNYGNMGFGDDHDINLIQKWQISDGIVSIDWRENILLVSTALGRVYYYQIDIQDHNKIYLVAHNESNPSEPVIYNHSALQQTSKYSLSAPGSWMHSLRINQVQSHFVCYFM